MGEARVETPERPPREIQVSQHPTWRQVTIRDTDVSSPEAIVRALYEVISGRADEPRDWLRQASLFAPGARLMPLGLTNGEITFDVFDIDSYQRSRTPMLASADFYEREFGRRIERFGDMAHVWSAYEARRSPDAAPFMRGINSFQLLHREGRWWILSVFWQNERPGITIPEASLTG